MTTYNFFTILSDLKYLQLVRSVKKKCVIFFCYGLVNLLLIACGNNESTQPALRVDQAIAVTFITAEPVNMSMSLETIAQTEGAKEIEIRPRVGGILLKRLYTEGTAVKAGQSLFLIDPEPVQNALAEAKAGFLEQNVRVIRARSEENRQRQLLAENFVSQRAYDVAKADLAIAEAALPEQFYLKSLPLQSLPLQSPPLQSPPIVLNVAALLLFGK